MSLTPDQFRASVDHLTTYFENVPEGDRQPFVTYALFGSGTLKDATYSGAAQTFATNLVTHLRVYDETTSLIVLLRHLKTKVGDPTRTMIGDLIRDIEGGDAPPKPAASGSAPTATTGYVFISYSHGDSAFVDRLRADLAAAHIAVWIDKEGLSPGTPNWERSIRKAIEDSQSLVWVVSPASFESEYVRSELAVGDLYSRTLYPVWADGDNWIECVPLGRHSIQYIDMRGTAYAAGLVRLIAALRGTGDFTPVAPDPAPAPASLEPENPYKGLFAFREADADRFFGREVLVDTLVCRLRAQLDGGKPRFLAVLGPSGAGKSSVVMAGLIPALKQDRVSGSRGWTILRTIAPGKHPIETLTDTLAPALGWSMTAVQQDLGTPGGRMLSRLAGQLPGERAILYVDQFEELFTQTADDGERQQFIDLITGAATDPGGKLIVLLSMRADFLNHALNYPQLGSLLNAYSEMVQPMTIAELRDAIEKPAQLPSAGLTFAPGLAAEIVFALRSRGAAMAGALPLLEFTLDRLFAEREGRRLTLAAYERMGGVEGAIGTHCEAVFTTLPESAQNALGRVFLPLVHIDENTGEPTRKRTSLADVTKDTDAALLVDALVKNRLLQTGSHNDGAYVEITHEALFRRWNRLVAWIATARADLALLNELKRDAARWEANGCNRDYLWRGEHGQVAQDMIARLQPALNAVERDFARPEALHLLEEIKDIDTPHARRSEIGTRLHELKFILPGAGLRVDGLPDVEWCYVDVPLHLRGSKMAFRDVHGDVYGEFLVEPFYVAKYLVTHLQFQAFIEAEDGFQNPIWWIRPVKEYEQAQQQLLNYPRDTVSWYEAIAFCRWLSSRLGGGYDLKNIDGWAVRLPRIYEWQWMVRNGSELREYPWLGNWDSRRCNAAEAGIGRSTAVGMYPHGMAYCGALDVCGNLWEWGLTNYEDLKNSEIATGFKRITHGDSWTSSFRHAKGTGYFYSDPYARDDDVGFRLCRPASW